MERLQVRLLQHSMFFHLLPSQTRLPVWSDLTFGWSDLTMEPGCILVGKRRELEKILETQTEGECFCMLEVLSDSITLSSRPRHPRIFCRLQSNVFYAGSLFQINYVVHWNTPREDIFSVWCRDFFVLRYVHSQHVYLQEESLPGMLHLKKSLWICPDHILSWADKQRPSWHFYGRQKPQ